jgi:hypothetical protein
MFGDQSMTPATIDRLVHHATIAIRAGKVHRHHDHDGTDVRRRVCAPSQLGCIRCRVADQSPLRNAW